MVYDIDSIKQQDPIEHVVAKRGIVLHDSGAHLVGRCPFHKDEHPSLCVYPETRSFYCFGCNAGGDVIDFVRRAEEGTKADGERRSCPLAQEHVLVAPAPVAPSAIHPAVTLPELSRRPNESQER